GKIVLEGVLVGTAATVLVALLTFVAHRRLPYKKMLVLTGTLLGLVLLVMVGEQVQEMQLAHWVSTTNISWLAGRIPDWMGLWFSVFPTVESLVAQLAAAALVIGSYLRSGSFLLNILAVRDVGPGALRRPQTFTGGGHMWKDFKAFLMRGNVI